MRAGDMNNSCRPPLPPPSKLSKRVSHFQQLYTCENVDRAIVRCPKKNLLGEFLHTTNQLSKLGQHLAHPLTSLNISLLSSRCHQLRANETVLSKRFCEEPRKHLVMNGGELNSSCVSGTFFCRRLGKFLAKRVHAARRFT